MEAVTEGVALVQEATEVQTNPRTPRGAVALKIAIVHIREAPAIEAEAEGF